MASLSAEHLFNVKGMVFAITGGGSGLGAMMAKALDANGAAKVYILGRRLGSLEDTAKAATNGSVIPIQADVTAKESLANAASKIESEVGFVNAVIANSGITGPDLRGLPSKPTVEELQSFLWKVPIEEFTNTFNVNTSAPFYTFIAFMHLLDAGNNKDASPGKALGIKSQFIITSSIAAYNRRATAGFAYGTSKAAAVHLMKMLAHYTAPYKIRCNVIAPGLYPSEMTDGRLGNTPTQEGSLPPEDVPLARAGSEEDMAGALLFLCSRAGAYIDGNSIITDGGRLSLMPATY